jgi:hypothetical protein
LVVGRGFLPRPSLYSRIDLNLTAIIHRKMLQGRKAGSEATVGRKPLQRVSVQECPAVSGSSPFSTHTKWKRTY